ncbi:MAG TPA: hypothetical protein VHV53_10265 [Solirubrobacterales bacterium]|jgi:hypothetical protein|nr:hypothetical protein [Solirubrobacterales bacterium]
MTLARFLIALAALALVAWLWSPIAMLVIVASALIGYGLCELIGEGGERFFIGDGHR